MKLFLLAALSLSTSSVYARKHNTGGDRDKHGCIKSAGETWCKSLGKCIHNWETTCPTNTGGDRDKHGCIGSAGETWCKSLGKCIHDWETTCPTNTGGDRDKHRCIGSAGESWCKPKHKCIRSWEENCRNGLRGAFTQFLTDLAVSEEEEPASTSVDTETGESLSSDSSVGTETEESLTSVDEE